MKSNRMPRGCGATLGRDRARGGAGCSSGGTDGGDRRRHGRRRAHAGRRCSSSGSPRRQFGGYYLAAANRATSGGPRPRRRDHPIGRSTSCRRTCSPPATSTSRSRGCRRCSASIEARREPHEHRPDLRAQRHPAGLVGRQDIDRSPRPRGQAGRHVGLRQRVGDLRGLAEGLDASSVHDRAAGLRHERLPATARSTRRRR